MFALHLSAQAPQHLKVGILLIAIGIVAFWRTVLKLVVIVAILLMVWETFTLLQILH